MDSELPAKPVRQLRKLEFNKGNGMKMTSMMTIVLSAAKRGNFTVVTSVFEPSTRPASTPRGSAKSGVVSTATKSIFALTVSSLTENLRNPKNSMTALSKKPLTIKNKTRIKETQLKSSTHFLCFLSKLKNTHTSALSVSDWFIRAAWISLLKCFPHRIISSQELPTSSASPV